MQFEWFDTNKVNQFQEKQSDGESWERHICEMSFGKNLPVAEIAAPSDHDKAGTTFFGKERQR